MNDAATPGGPRPSSIGQRKSKAWIWFFALLIGLTAAAITAEVWYNLNRQLDPDKLAAARRLWNEKGPRSYQLAYVIRREDGSEQKYTVVVEQGKVISVARSSQPLERGAYPFDSMDALFDYVEEQLRADARPGVPRVFVSAVFDRGDGHILRYVRSVRSPRERVEVTVRLHPPPEQQSVRQPPPTRTSAS